MMRSMAVICPLENVWEMLSASCTLKNIIWRIYPRFVRHIQRDTLYHAFRVYHAFPVYHALRACLKNAFWHMYPKGMICFTVCTLKGMIWRILPEIRRCTQRAWYSGLHWLNLGKILRKVGSADAGNDFSNTLWRSMVITIFCFCIIFPYLLILFLRGIWEKLGTVRKWQVVFAKTAVMKCTVP